MQPSVTLPDLKINASRLQADFDAVSQIGATAAGGVNRLALSTEDLLARAWFADRLEDAGLILHDDDAGNLSGILPCANLTAKTLMIGSHLDTVPNGGRFDGTVGIVAALECARTIREAGLQLPVHLEVIDWTDDEGCWRSLFGVRALTGLLVPEDVNDVRVDNGPFRAALHRAGIDPRNVFAAKRDLSTLMGYLELHIEQGQRLEQAHTCIGAVTGIVGRATFRITFHGQAAHSGTTDMNCRRDALRGAALFISRAHDLVRERFGDGIFNCGKIDVEPGAFNIIPSRAQLTTEVRHVNARLLTEMENALLSLARECAADNLLTVDIERIAGMPAADMDERVVQIVEQSAEQLGCSHMRLVSYSGHAAQMTSIAVPSGMIFIPSIDGVSHNPHEYSRWEDVVAGTNVLLRAIISMALNHMG